MTRRIRVFDTSLRDGEQAPGMGMGPEQKVTVARALVDLEVDIIEAGFAASSEADSVALSLIGREIGLHATVASLARAVPADIEAAAAALDSAPRPRIHVFVPSSDLHITAKLGSSRDAVLAAAEAGIRLARGYVDDVQFGLEDASRADRDFLAALIRAGIAAGAATVAVADTVGYMLPCELSDLVADLYLRVPELASVVLSVHCHDDLGMAVANSLAGVAAGASQVECTILGIGERAGNAALEEIIMALQVRSAFFDCATSVRTTGLCAASRVLADVVGLAIPPNKAIVGSNSFAHEAGIHQHGVLRNALTYEIMSPAAVGAESSKLVFGRHSGRHALEAVLSQHGISLPPDELEALMARIKASAGRSGAVPVDEIISWCRAMVGASGGVG